MIKNLEKGFTLIEFVLYMGLLSILLVVLISIFGSILDVQIRTDATGGVDMNARYLIARLTSDIHAASDITTPSAPGGITGNLQLVINAINYTYTTDNNGNVTITNNNGTDVLNGYDASISAVAFRRIGNTGGKNSIQFGFTIASRTSGRAGPEIKTYQTTIGTR